MKKVGILYICTGKYDIFWQDFYKSSEKYFLNDCEKHYYVFTDSKKIYGTDKNKNIHVIYQESLPWPLATLLRFHIFNKNEKYFSNDDYLFFMNANLLFVDYITSDEFLPEDNSLLFTQHPGMYGKNKRFFTYDRNKKSTAYIPRGKGKHYVAGGLNGGPTNLFLKMSKIIEDNINEDLKNNIIALWHDESQINKFVFNLDNYKLLSPAYLYPEGGYKSLIGISPKIIIRDKNNYGGHNNLRGNQND